VNALLECFTNCFEYYGKENVIIPSKSVVYPTPAPEVDWKPLYDQFQDAPKRVGNFEN
jgi:hypothetical protein